MALYAIPQVWDIWPRIFGQDAKGVERTDPGQDCLLNTCVRLQCQRLIKGFGEGEPGLLRISAAVGFRFERDGHGNGPAGAEPGLRVYPGDKNPVAFQSGKHSQMHHDRGFADPSICACLWWALAWPCAGAIASIDPVPEAEE